jgi:type II secretory pathway pseudopilin PulG
MWARWQGMQQRSAHGLSRLEFAVAMAVVGVLIAVALPRMDGARVAARQVRLQSLMATAQSSAMLFHLRCEAQAATAGADPRCEQVTLEGQNIAGVHGWPAANANGIAEALKLWGPVADIDWQPDRLDGVPALRATLTPTKVAGTCEFIYAQAASPGAAPRIELTDASCP